MDHGFLVLDCLTHEAETVSSIKISVTAYPAARGLIPEDLNVQESYCVTHVLQ
jgi:hypothetical protein